MKKLNIFLLIILILLLGFVAYFFIGGTLAAQANIVTAPASDHREAFDSIRGVVASNAAPQQYAGSLPQSPEGYTLIDVSITLTNNGLFPAEWLHITAAPLPGDVAVYSLTGEGSDIAARSASQVNLKVVTTEASDADRTVTITYYTYGIPRRIDVSF